MWIYTPVVHVFVLLQRQDASDAQALQLLHIASVPRL